MAALGLPRTNAAGSGEATACCSPEGSLVPSGAGASPNSRPCWTATGLGSVWGWDYYPAILHRQAKLKHKVTAQTARSAVRESVSAVRSNPGWKQDFYSSHLPAPGLAQQYGTAYWKLGIPVSIAAGSAQPPKATHPRCSLFPCTRWDCARSELGAVFLGIVCMC